MERKLQYHEKKLLKKVDFLEWKNEKNIREIEVLRRYRIQDREDYTKYNKLCMNIKKLAYIIQRMDAQDPFRLKMTEQLLEKMCVPLTLL
jgi:U3 small nucleolar ribonucleoprotein protein IMP3